MDQKKTPKKIFSFLVSVFFVIILFIIAFWLHFLFTPIVTTNPVTYVLEEGTSAQSLATDLHSQANLTHPVLFRILIKLRNDGPRLKAGEYQFQIGSTPSDILNQTVNGKIYYHTFTIVNGWHYLQMMTALNNTSGLKHSLKNKTAKQVARAIGVKRYSTPEGLLLPNTYYFVKGQTDIAVLERAHTAMRDFLANAWPARAKKLPYRNFYQALIVASMIEKEASLPNERPIVAAVILKRYQKWMHLQIDATVIYGLGEKFTGNLSKADLKKKTPYNTYTRYGLPPTPIAMPGKSAIEAALHPATTKALYYVAKGDGSHVFSNTLKEQNAAVLKYQK